MEWIALRNIALHCMERLLMPHICLKIRSQVSEAPPAAFQDPKGGCKRNPQNQAYPPQNQHFQAYPQNQQKFQAYPQNNQNYSSPQNYQQHQDYQTQNYSQSKSSGNTVNVPIIGKVKKSNLQKAGQAAGLAYMVKEGGVKGMIGGHLINKGMKKFF